MRTPPPGFCRPDYSNPFNVEERLRGISSDRTIKGFFLQGLLKTARKTGRALPEEQKYISFKDYPSSEAARLVVAVARHLHPDVPLQEGLRRMGQSSFTSMSDSVLGRVILGTVGLKLETLLESVPRIFPQFLKNGNISLEEITESSARFRLWGFAPDFLDCTILGLFEGILMSYRKSYDVFLRSIEHGSAELWGFWE